MRRRFAWLLALALVTTACGTRLSHSRLAADWRGGSSGSQGASAGQDSASGGSGSLAAGDTGAAAGGGSSSGATGSTGGGGAAATTGASGGGGTTGSSGGGGSTGGGASGGGGSTGGGAGGGGSTGGIGISAGQQCGAPKSPITIGSVGAQSGVVGASVNGTNAIRAWVSAINAKGGLSCHPVKYVVSDDGSDPSRNQAAIQQLVEQNHAVAIVYYDAPLDGDASLAYINQHHVPVIGTESAQDWSYTSPYFFLQGDNGATQDQDLFNVAATTKPHGSVAIFACVEAKACSNVTSAGPGYAQKSGLNLVSSSQVSLAQPDFTAQCQTAKSKGAEVVMLYVDVNSIDRVLRSCSSINYHPQYAAYSLAAALSTARDPLAEGLVAALGVMPWVVSSNPAIQSFTQTMSRYAPGAEVGLKESLAWGAVKLFEAAGQRLPDAPTPQDILNGLWTIKNQDFGGMTNSLTFTQNQPPPRVGCTWVVQVRGGQWTSPNNGQKICSH
jgi:branched-chain amino acid transport system substrate-binding protein